MKIWIGNLELAVSWSPQIDWDTPAGRTLQRLFAALPEGRRFTVTLFGSSPLQLGIEPTFTSADVDLFAGDWGELHEEVVDAVQRAGLAKEQGAEPYVQVCVESNFRTTPHWHRRAWSIDIGSVRLVLPHPMDILIAKLHRLEKKDLRAFRLVIERTGHPTEEEMRRELQAAVDLYRPNFDETVCSDITTNTRILWQELWNKDIDVRQEIIAPARTRQLRGYADDLPREQYRADLEKYGES